MKKRTKENKTAILIVLFFAVLFALGCNSKFDHNNGQMKSVRLKGGYVFKCPEAYANENERVRSVSNFLNWALKYHQDWTLNQMVRFRMDLLTKCNCKTTLSNIHYNNQMQQ